MRILVVEDNLLNQSVAVRLLERLGHNADVAANGVEAIAKVASQPYDLVLMDIEMPVMNGLDAARGIRARQPSESGPAIVAVTAHVLEQDRQECLDAGMNGFLRKPFRIEELTAVIDDHAAPAPAP